MWIFIAFLILLPIAFAGLSLAPYVPTFPSDKKRLLDILPNEEKKFLEVGCGLGDVSLWVAKNYPEYQVTALEIAFPLYVVAKLRAIVSGQKNLTILYKNALKYDFSPYDIIYIYGLPENMDKKILPKYEQEMQTGSLLISYVFTL